MALGASKKGVTRDKDRGSRSAARLSRFYRRGVITWAHRREKESKMRERKMLINISWPAHTRGGPRAGSRLVVYGTRE